MRLKKKKLKSNTSSLPPCKALGQHFLVDASILQSIVDLLKSLPSGASIQWVEVGPGLGALSRPCLAQLAIDPSQWVGIEADGRMVEHLRSDPQLGAYLWLHADALCFPYEKLVEAPHPPCLRWIGNLPYNIGTALLVHWLTLELHWDHMVLMLQKEVAEVICAEANSPKRSRLSLIAEYFCQRRLVVLEAPPSAFDPAPKVTSSLLLLERRLHPLPIAWQQLEPCLKRGFLHRRKQLRNNFRASHDGGPALELPEPWKHQRPQELTLEDWLGLTQLMLKKG